MICWTWVKLLLYTLTILVCATLNESHPKLFEKVADHINGLGNLDKFDPQALSNKVWVYATAKESHPEVAVSEGWKSYHFTWQLG